MTRKTEPRRRRSAEEARRVILDAAEKRLAEGGPEAVRLQDIAGDVGISHPAILHHFGSRDGLTEALSQRAIDALDRDLLGAIEDNEAGAATVLGMIEQILGAMGDSGHSRLLAWRALQSSSPVGDAEEPTMLSHVTDALHRWRVEHALENGLPEPELEQTWFVVRLAATATLGEAVCGQILDLAVDPAAREDLPRRFRSWLLHLFATELGVDAQL